MADALSATPNQKARKALVTGGARGIGRATCIALAAAGMDIAVVDRDLRSYTEFPEEAQQAAAMDVTDEVARVGRETFGVEGDVCLPGTAEDAVSEVAKRWGQLDVLVCCAGGATGSLHENKASDVDLGVFRRDVEVNLFGTVTFCQAAARLMKRQRSGSIVTVGSVNGLEAIPDGSLAAYGASKAAVISYSLYLAQELAAYNVRVNAVVPGPVATGRILAKYRSLGEDPGVAVPLGRMIRPEEVADVICFLASDAARQITGTAVRVDGGLVRCV